MAVTFAILPVFGSDGGLTAEDALAVLAAALAASDSNSTSSPTLIGGADAPAHARFLAHTGWQLDVGGGRLC